MSSLQGYRSWPFWLSEFFCTDLKSLLLQDNTGCGSGGSALPALTLPIVCISRIGEEEPETEQLRKKKNAELIWSYLSSLTVPPTKLVKMISCSPGEKGIS